MINSTYSRLPAVRGRNLAGIDFVLPQDLRYDLNLLIISFYSWQSTVKDMWARNAAAVSDRYEELDVYECNLPANHRAELDGELRHEREHGIHSFGQRQKILSVYTPRDKLLQELKIHNDRQVSVILVRRDGRIVWRAEGHPGVEKILSLVSAVHHHIVIERV